MSGIVKSVDKALDILEHIANNRGSGISDIARDLTMKKSTVFSLVKTFETRGYIFKDEITDNYMLTYKVQSLANIIIDESSLLAFVRPILKEISEKYGETIYFSTEVNDEVANIEKIECNKPIRIYSNYKDMMPMYSSAIGKSMLAYKNNAQVDLYLEGRELTGTGPNTITNKDELKKNLQEIRERGYAIDNQEIQEELFGIAVGIVNTTAKPYYSIGIKMPKFRATETFLNDVIADLKLAKEKVENFF